MPSQAAITKIEILTEAIEALVLASVVAATDHSGGRKNENHQNVVDAREVLSKALTEALAPNLRVVEPQIGISSPSPDLIQFAKAGGPR